MNHVRHWNQLFFLFESLLLSSHSIGILLQSQTKKWVKEFRRLFCECWFPPIINTDKTFYRVVGYLRGDINCDARLRLPKGVHITDHPSATVTTHPWARCTRGDSLLKGKGLTLSYFIKLPRFTYQRLGENCCIRWYLVPVLLYGDHERKHIRLVPLVLHVPHLDSLMSWLKRVKTSNTLNSRNYYYGCGTVRRYVFFSGSIGNQGSTFAATVLSVISCQNYCM